MAMTAIANGPMTRYTFAWRNVDSATGHATKRSAPAISPNLSMPLRLERDSAGSRVTPRTEKPDFADDVGSVSRAALILSHEEQ